VNSDPGTEQAPPAGSLADLPEAARSRLESTAAKGGSWTSDLSVAELSAVRRVGFRPVGMVVGMSVYQIAVQGIGPAYFGLPAGGWGSLGAQGMGAGWSPAGFRGHFKGYPCTHAVYGLGHGYGVNYEDLYYEQALDETFRLAHDRLKAEATALGAHGVVGLRHTLSDLQVASSAPVVELKMVGTAISRPTADPLHEPFTSHLSGQDFAKLLDTGRVPAGLVFGTGAVRSSGGCVGMSSATTWSGSEFVQRSEAVQQAQRIAVDALEDQAQAVGDQVIGVDVSLSIREGQEAAMVSMRAIGTAVRRFRAHEEDAVPRVLLRLSDNR
jgi:uncharacterized protein YbjQ (UPF0145 family)